MNGNAGNPPPQCVFWDWNGTLQDDLHAAVAGTNAILSDQGKAPVDAARYRAVFSFPARGCYEALGIEVTERNWAALCDRFFRVFSSDPSVRLFPGAEAALRALRAAGAVQAVVSSSERNALESALVKYGIRDCFAEVCGQEGAAAGSKVAAARALFARIGADPARTWMIGDTGHDKEVADALGIRCLLVSSGYESSARLASHGAPVLRSVADVPEFFGFAPLFQTPLGGPFPTTKPRCGFPRWPK